MCPLIQTPLEERVEGSLRVLSCVPRSLGTWYLTSAASLGRGQSGGGWDLVMARVAAEKRCCIGNASTLAVDWTRTDSEGGTG